MGLVGLTLDLSRQEERTPDRTFATHQHELPLHPSVDKQSYSGCDKQPRRRDYLSGASEVGLERRIDLGSDCCT